VPGLGWVGAGLAASSLAVYAVSLRAITGGDRRERRQEIGATGGKRQGG
jgi:hypothetical protein